MAIDFSGDVNPVGIRAIETLVASDICRSAWYAQRCDSTNSQAMDDMRRGAVDRQSLPRLYLTDQQTAGRGRHGRGWVGSHQNLTFSLLINDRFDAPHAQSSERTVKAILRMLPLGVGVAIAQTIEHDFAPLRASLKWPNDVWLGGAKVAGVLLERPTGHPMSTDDVDDTGEVVIGVGMNVGESPDLALSSNLATCLDDIVGRPVDRFAVLVSVVERLVDMTSAFFDRDASVVIGRTLDAFRARCVLTGQDVSFTHHGQQLRGRCEGVDELGRLQIRFGGHVYPLESGEANLIRPLR